MLVWVVGFGGLYCCGCLVLGRVVLWCFIGCFCVFFFSFGYLFYCCVIGFFVFVSVILFFGGVVFVCGGLVGSWGFVVSFGSGCGWFEGFFGGGRGSVLFLGVVGELVVFFLVV